jgi:flagellar biosynthesis/type III secretory pathway chaperone
MQQSTDGMQPTWPTQGVVPPDVLKNFPPGSYEYMKNGDYWEVFDAAGNKMANFTVDSMNESYQLTNEQITSLFGSIAIQEGLWDQFKQKTANIVGSPEERAEVGQQIKQGVSAVAGAVSQKAQTVGKNITTKITADKLNKAWTAAGSPTDSDAVAKFLTTQGVNPDVVNSAMSAVGVSSAAGVEQEQPAVDTSKLPDVSSLTPEQKQALLAKLDQLDKAEAGSASSTKIRTGGKVAGQVSQTPNAIRKRQARLASKSVNAQPTDAPDYTTSMAELIKQRQAKGMTESTEYMHFKTKLRKALSK